MQLSAQNRAFTIIEMLVVTGVIAILASLTVINLSSTRATARDASRKESVKGYQQSMEQYRASRGTYFVYKKGAQQNQSDVFKEITTDADGNMVEDPSSQHYGDISFVGYKGGGWGRITTKAAASRNYPNPTYSIADALQLDGFLAEVRTDPRASGFSDPKGSSADPSSYNDFLLTLCGASGAEATKPADAVEYAIFANLERPAVVASDASDHLHLCGGSETNYGWDTLVYGVAGSADSLASR